MSTPDFAPWPSLLGCFFAGAAPPAGLFAAGVLVVEPATEGALELGLGFAVTFWFLSGGGTAFLEPMAEWLLVRCCSPGRDGSDFGALVGAPACLVGLAGLVAAGLEAGLLGVGLADLFGWLAGVLFAAVFAVPAAGLDGVDAAPAGFFAALVAPPVAGVFAAGVLFAAVGVFAGVLAGVEVAGFEGVDAAGFFAGVEVAAFLAGVLAAEAGFFGAGELDSAFCESPILLTLAASNCQLCSSEDKLKPAPLSTYIAELRSAS